MISLTDAYRIVSATIPLYAAMILGYISVKCLNLLNPDQCSGINKFVAKFSIPLLSFQVISKSNPYKLNLKLICADVLQKTIAFIVIAVITRFRSNGNLNWIITGISLSTLPNTLILGIPMLKALYGEEAEVLLSQIVVVQSLIWYNLLLFMFELSAAREAHMMQSSAAMEEGEGRQEARATDEIQETNMSISRRKKLMLLISTVGKKLLTNPNSHATVAGLAWAFISFGYNVKLPKVVEDSVSIISDGGLGMAMFSLGLFMASQARIVACGTQLALLAMVLRFIVGPAIMAAPSIAIGLKGVPFQISVIQAALPQGIVSFVFAKEYNVHPEILSTGYSDWLFILTQKPGQATRQNTDRLESNYRIFIGLLVALPVALVYYLLLSVVRPVFLNHLSAFWICILELAIMVKGPGLYSDIGKKARDLLYKDYQGDHKFTITTYSPTGVAITSSGTKKGELFLADVNTQLKRNNITTDIKVDTYSNLSTTITIDEPLPGLKTILSFKVPDQRSGKVELQYLHDYAGICASVGVDANPIVNFSGVLGNNISSIGADVSFDTKTGNFTKYNAGLSFSNADLIAALTLNDKGDSLNASYYHIVKPLTNTLVGAEVNHSFSTNENTITVGTQHSLDPLTTVKARVNNYGKASALIQHEWRPKSLFTLSGEVDTKAIDKSAKFGLALALKP
ncbi:hypothetical protein E3N88_02650 [Mikania micrantha]|uniref:Auxin efflux carrier component n=2 Tax=Magnoliopsida TaxID=3398 RepID=A0A5N6Q4C6_9ASTR|nr:hypothetical protein E3N88_02650 [Mikania micrantha]